MDYDGPFVHMGNFQILFWIFGGLVWLIGIALALAVLFFLIRFLLIATKAAELYVAKNGPSVPSTRAATVAPTSTTATVTKPATKPRAPRKPTT